MTASTLNAKSSVIREHIVRNEKAIKKAIVEGLVVLMVAFRLTVKIATNILLVGVVVALAPLLLAQTPMSFGEWQSFLQSGVLQKGAIFGGLLWTAMQMM